MCWMKTVIQIHTTRGRRKDQSKQIKDRNQVVSSVMREVNRMYLANRFRRVKMIETKGNKRIIKLRMI